jgi:serine/threonine-protein kinase
MGSAGVDAKNFQRIEALFNAALERSADEREAFVRASDEEPAIRDAALRLLARAFEDDATLQAAALAAAAVALPRAKRIGPYEVLGELGTGGMGTVLLAERAFGDSKQKVALKLIRGFPTAHAREQLARERSLLAGLNHPNIAGLLDAGETDDHVPYLAMEYVEGIPLHRYCTEHGLGQRARLTLFVKLCRAVQHAHQRLIVHRDIKPANVLVREDGTPVLLDFGIGKLLDASALEATSTRAFTPAYAAPEQLAGRTVTTATDVYGLGCVLHELLSGRLLHEFAGARIPPPSAAATDSTLSRGLRGELDTLVGKAMHDEPERRYASAQALADDVENYLAGRPLRGAPDNLAYRARKFAARHRFGVAASIIIAALAVAFVWSLNNERRRAVAAEARAEREAKSTRRSRDFLVSLFEAASPENSLGRPTSAREVIDKGNAHLEQELKDEPETAARLSLTIAQVYSAFGDPKASIAAGERALALATGDAAETELLRAEILLTLATGYDNTERFDDARRSAEDALALRQRHTPDDHAAIAEAMTEAAATGVRRGDHAVARAFFDRAIAEQGKAARIEPLQRAQLLRGVSELDDAEGKLADSLKHALESVAALADLPPTSPVRIDFWRVLATAQVANADPGGAVATLQHALDVGHAALGENSYTVADIENDIAVALNGQGRYREAIPHLEKSIEITEAMRPGAHVATAFSVVNLGSLYENLGDYAKSEQLMREGIASIEAEAPDTPELDSFRCNLARTLMKRGKFAEARALFDRALHNIAAREGAQSFGYAFQTFRLSRLEYAAGNLESAEADLRDSERILDPLLPVRHALRVQFNVVHAQLAKAHGDLATAQAAMEKAEAAQGAMHGNDPLDMAIIRMRFAGILLARGDLIAARRKLDGALPLIDSTLLPQAVEVVEAHAYRDELARRESPAGR